jgi:hypothetical protein
LPFQAKRHGIADDTTLTVRSPAASLGYISGVQTAQYVASPPPIHHVASLTAELGGGNVQVYDLDVAVDHKCRYGHRVEYCPIKLIVQRGLQVGPLILFVIERYHDRLRLFSDLSTKIYLMERVAHEV